MTTTADKIVRNWWHKLGDFKLMNTTNQYNCCNLLAGFLQSCEQCKLIEELVINAQTNNTLIVTNSSYFVDHLRNMMEASKKKNQDQIKEKFILKDKRAFIKVKDVAVFDCEDGVIKNVLKRTGAIDWDTFSKVAEDLCDIYFKMEEPDYVGLS
jgi:hypothetical protein